MKKQAKKKEKQGARSARRAQRKDNYSFLNFTNSGDFLNTGIGRTRAAPAASGRTLLTTKPKWSTMRENTLVSHSEYISDVAGSTTFSSVVYPINPGLGQTFVWLNSIAPNYERYRFRRLRFRYEVLSSSTTAGKVFYVPNFNVQDPPPIDKTEALSFEYAVGSQPWLQFGIDVPERFLRTYNEFFVRTSPLNSGEDLKTFDTLNLYVCTEGTPSGSVGELWIDYEVELINPIGSGVSTNYTALYAQSLAAVQPASVFGSFAQFPLGLTASFTAQAGGLPFTLQEVNGGSGGANGFSRMTFTEGFTGLLTFYWLFGSGASPEWGPYVQPTSTVTDLSGSALGTFDEYSSIVVRPISGTQTMSGSLFVMGSPGQYLDLSIIWTTGTSPTPDWLQGVTILANPGWYLASPPERVQYVEPMEKRNRRCLEVLKDRKVSRERGRLVLGDKDKEERELHVQKRVPPLNLFCPLHK
jgi:hypothetical protein